MPKRESPGRNCGVTGASKKVSSAAGGKGRMNPLEQRSEIMKLYQEAKTSGARQYAICQIIGLNPKTIQRWNKPDKLQCDGRKTREFIPQNKITEDERQKVIDTCDSSEFCEMTPNQIVPILAERGIYIASERTFYRILKEENQLTHRQKSKPKTKCNKPKALCANEPGQILTWDITYLKTTVLGHFFYLYLFIDIFSRKIVGWQIHDQESSQLAADIVMDIAKTEKYIKGQVHVHSDNGSPMKGAAIHATFHKLGIIPSDSRPSVSNDNPYSESLFKTLKYCPYYPDQPFNDIQEARQWMIKFTDWSNNQHRHSSIKYVTPSQRHDGLDVDILAARKQTYERAKENTPARWSGSVRNGEREGDVLLNPAKKNEIDIEMPMKMAA